MKERIINSVEKLASIEFQRRYVINGTVAEYALPQDLIYDAENAIDVTLNTDKFRKELTDSEINALKSLKDTLSDQNNLESVFDDSISAYDLIESDKKWDHIRNEAQKVLKVIV
jgi:hypothetical protein